MKPAPFEYFVPTSVEEAVELLARHGDDAKVLAGGQSLVPMMNFRLAQPAVLIDINRIVELGYIREGDSSIAIGAMTRQRVVETSPMVRDKCAILSEALANVGHQAIRNRGTMGGTLAHGDPAAEVATVLLTLGGSVTVAGPQGKRELSPEELLAGPYAAGISSDELIVEINFPILAANETHGFLEMSRRHGDFALVGVAAVLRMVEGNICERARVALCGVAPTPVRATEVENQLTGKRLDASTIQAAAELASRAVDCEDEYHASREYRTHLCQVYVRRTIQLALERWGNN